MGKILIVDDEKSIREILIHFISGHFELEIMEASSGEEAIGKLKSANDIRVVICDYRMPMGNGGDVYSYVKELGSAIPFVMMSTDPPEKYPVFEGFREANLNNEFLKKPFRKDKLISCLEKILN